jgi:hypothetical protein
MTFDGATVWEKFQRDGEGGLIGLLCSRNARSRTALVGRAQWETDSGYPPVGEASQFGRCICMCCISAFDSVTSRTQLYLENRARSVGRHKNQECVCWFGRSSNGLSLRRGIQSSMEVSYHCQGSIYTIHHLPLIDILLGDVPMNKVIAESSESVDSSKVLADLRALRFCQG